MFRIFAIMLVLSFMTACTTAVPPGTVTNTFGCAKSNPNACFERIELTGAEGVSVVDIDAPGGVGTQVAAQGTRAQLQGTQRGRMEQAVTTAVVSPLAGGAVGLIVDKVKSNRCPDGNCHVGGNQFVIQGGNAQAVNTNDIKLEADVAAGGVCDGTFANPCS